MLNIDQGVYITVVQQQGQKAGPNGLTGALVSHMVNVVC